MIKSAPVPPRIRYLSKYLRYLMDELNLLEWGARFSEYTPTSDDSTTASVEFGVGQRQFSLRLAPSFWLLPADDQCRVLVHELMHVRLHELVSAADSVREPLGSTAWSVFSAVFDQEHELVTDALAIAVAKYLDPPRFP